MPIPDPPPARAGVPTVRAVALAMAVAALCAGVVRAEPDPVILREEARRNEIVRPDGVHILDGSFVLDQGELHLNVTNHGLLGSQYTQTFPYSNAASGQWPGGSGDEYLWGAGLWVGAVSGGQTAVSTGQPEREFRPGDGPLETIYEGREGRVMRPTPSDAVTGRRQPTFGADDDDDGLIDEDPLNGHDDDGDGLIDEDFGQIGAQMFTCTMSDNTALSRELYPDHQPLDLKIVQRIAAFYQADYENAALIDYEITNIGPDELNDVYLGMYVDCDIQRRASGSSNPDDLAGFFNGAVRGRDGTFYRMQIGWMCDADPTDPLPGYFGTMLLGHDTDPLEYWSPHITGVRSFQIFATNALTEQNGEPLSDEERYEVMARRQIDRDRRPSQPGDLKYMFSSGPFPRVLPGRTLHYRTAMVAGNGLDGMLRSALKAAELHRGVWIDADRDWRTGNGGRETKVCLGDYPPLPDGGERLFSYRYEFVDEFCTGSYPIFGKELIAKRNMEVGPDGRLCIMVNADNCEECFRRFGVECDQFNNLYWNGGSGAGYASVTGTYSRETNVPWVFPGNFPPVPPHLRVVPGDGSAELFWDDISEHDYDPDTGQIDFESYRIFRVADWSRPGGTGPGTAPESVLWNKLAEYDIVNFVPGEFTTSGHDMALGLNTGLDDVVYTPACLADPRFAGLAEAMQEIVDADTAGRLLTRPLLRGSGGTPVPGLETLLPWEAWPAVLDTFFAVAVRPPRGGADPVVEKRATRYYHFRDEEVHNGFLTYYSVVPTDHVLEWNGVQWRPVGFGEMHDPDNNQVVATPAPRAQTAVQREQQGVNIYVYPNPATKESLEEYQRQPPSAQDPTGVRVTFNNLPAARNRITIYTASGDLVATVQHDGSDGYGAASWNLVSRNGQEVTSGIYLYAVESDDPAFAPFRGRFVVVR